MDNPKREKIIEDYWLRQLSGDLPKLQLPILPTPDNGEIGEIKGKKAQLRFDIPASTSLALETLSKGSDISLFTLVFAAVYVTVNRYTGIDNLVIGTVPPGKEPKKSKIILSKNWLSGNLTLKKTINLVKEQVLKDFGYADFSFGALYQKLISLSPSGNLDVFNIAFIHDGLQVKNNALNQFHILFILSSTPGHRFLDVEYYPSLYSHEIIRRFCRNLVAIFDHFPEKLDRPISQLEMVCAEEQQELLDFNGAAIPFPEEKTIPTLFEEQVKRTPENIAVVNKKTAHELQELNEITYRELNEQANRLARALREKGISRNSVVGLLETPSIDMVVEMLAVLKAGGAYLPMDAAAPQNRLVSMLDDCHATHLLTRTNLVKNYSYTALQGLKNREAPVIFTPARKQINPLDSLPIPDRSMVDYEKYNRYIGQVLVKNIISLQTARGCPFQCAYCSKVWPPKHVFRSAENIFQELQVYYKMGIRRFSIFDDIFNVNSENGKRLFQMIIDKGLKVQLFFPNGMRGDLLDKKYIDLAAAAGLSATAMALETASPRLQKLIKKSLHLEKFRENIEYFCQKYPGIILELFTMHGFPTETEEEAGLTMEFIKSLKWVHFPYVFILKIYPGTEMADLAMQHGVYREDILKSEDMAFHEYSPTSPFEKSFTRKYQSEFLNGYFLSRERLLHVLPFQAKVLTEDEIIQKYDSYLPFNIKSFEDILELAGITREELNIENFRQEEEFNVPDLNRKLQEYFPVHKPAENALRVLFLDLTQYFSNDISMLYDVVEPPLGAMYIMTYLKQQLGEHVDGKILKSRIDFDSYEELKTQMGDFNPHVIAVRSLTFYRDFFHRTIALVRQWGFGGPIIAGGPYATRNAETLIQDKNIDLAVRSEGEITFCEIITRIIDHSGQLPPEEVLRTIDGIVFAPCSAPDAPCTPRAREVLSMDTMADILSQKSAGNLEPVNGPSDMAYIIFTSGSTGVPKGVIIEHRSVVNVLTWFARTYNVGPQVRVMQMTNYTFDPSVEQVFGTLLHGGELYMVEQALAGDKEAFRRFIDEHQIHIVNFVPGALKYLLEDEEPLRNLRVVISGGEKLDEDLKNRLIKKGYPLYNHYGPTETTIDALMEKCSEAGVTLGRPIANVECYVLFSGGTLAPVGVAGELYIGGVGVARGYLNNPELTAERFCLRRPGNPFEKWFPGPSQNFYLNKSFCGGVRGAVFSKKAPLFYRTGDLVRWLPAGNIEFLGRIDHQVKIRGFRIELGEVENRLLKYLAVKEAVVLLRENKTKEKYLCAYIVSVSYVDVSELKNYLSGCLPVYMIPAEFVLLDKLPTTSSGKVDRAALPEPLTIEEVTPQDRPNTEIERKIAELWSEVLEIEKDNISVHADFFASGGHSMKAVLLVSAIHKSLGVKLTLQDIFKTPTIKGLAEAIADAHSESYTPVELAEKKEYYPLSSAQKRLFILQRLDETGTGYNTPSFVELAGALDKDRLGRAFCRLIRRHESLRTSFTIISSEPVQQVHDTLEFTIPVPGETTDLALGQKIKAFVKPFDLTEAPLLRVEMLRLAENKHLLMFDMHHIITDGVSTGVFLNDFTAFYSGASLSPLKLQYKDYAQWEQRLQESGAADTQAAFWQDQFRDGIPVLDLPTDFPRPNVQRFKGCSLNFEITPEQAAQLKALAQKANVTLFNVLLSAYHIFLTKLCRQETIVIGTAVAGRRFTELAPIIGMFVNTLTLKNHPNNRKTVDLVIQEINRKTLEVFENQDYPFEQLVEAVVVNRDTGRNPLFDVMFLLQNIDIPEIEIPGLKLQPYRYDIGISKFDLTLQAVEVQKNIHFTFEYSTDLFKEDTVRRFIEYFKLAVIAIAQQPLVRVADIEIIPGAEKQRILVEFNDTGADYPADKTLHQLFEDQAGQTPDHIAVTAQTNAITYWQLNENANRLARLLISKGVAIEGITAVMAERSPALMVGLLGILKAGAAYLPISPDLPPARKKYMLEDSRARHLLSQQHLYNQNKALMEGLARENIIFLGQEENVPVETVSNPGIPVGPQNPGYIIYTSGSTGRPRGVVLEHGGIVNYLHWAAKQYVRQNRGSFPFYTSISFDLTVTSMFTPLVTGNTVVVYDGAENDFILHNIIEEDRVDIIKLTPAHLKLLRAIMMGKENSPATRRLKAFIVGGENLETRLAEDIAHYFNNCGGITIYNEYGPTETVVGSVIHRFDPHIDKGVSVIIGKPIANTQVYLLDENKALVPIGVAGEFYIGGVGVARGYLNNPDLNVGRFCLRRPGNPFEKGFPGPSQNFLLDSHPTTPLFYQSPYQSPLYKTGDLGRRLPSGNIEFLGRIDRQLKIRGFRIEPGEIEARLMQHPQVKEAVVRPETHQNGDEYICAYVVLDSEPTLPQLREYLAGTLPTYMIPAYFVPIETIPLTANGKVDWRALPDPATAAIGATSDRYTAPRGKVEEKLAEIWAELLKIQKDNISTHDDFFASGGNSMIAILLAAAIHKNLSVKLTLQDIFKTPTIKGLAGIIAAAQPETFIPVEPVEKKEYYPLSSAQMRIYIMQQMKLESIAYNIPQLVPLKEEPRLEQLEDAFMKLIGRHESLRTSFQVVEGEIVQRVHERVKFEIEILKTKVFGSPKNLALREGFSRKDFWPLEAIIKSFHRPFDLSVAPLLRTAVIKAAEGKYLLLVDMHHIISDGVSHNILATDFATFYLDERQELLELPPLRLQYKDYAVWQAEFFTSEAFNQQENYWLQALQGRLPILTMPFDFKRPERQSFEGRIVSFTLSTEVTTRINELALKHDVTLNILLFSLYSLLISKYSEQDDIIIGSLSAGRNHADLQTIIGMFANFLPIRIKIKSGVTFDEFLQSTAQALLNAYENQDYPFEKLIDRLKVPVNLSRNPLFDTMMIFHNQQPLERRRLESIVDFDGDGDTSHDPLYRSVDRVSTLDLKLDAEPGPAGELNCYLQYDTALFAEETVRDFARHFRLLVDKILENPLEKIV